MSDTTVARHICTLSRVTALSRADRQKIEAHMRDISAHDAWGEIEAAAKRAFGELSSATSLARGSDVCPPSDTTKRTWRKRRMVYSLTTLGESPVCMLGREFRAGMPPLGAGKPWQPIGVTVLRSDERLAQIKRHAAGGVGLCADTLAATKAAWEASA